MTDHAAAAAAATAATAAANAVAALQGENLAAFNSALQIIRDNRAPQPPPGPARAARGYNLKGIPCSNYMIGQDYGVWRTYFRDNVRAIYSLPETHDDLDELCLQWVSTRLDPGPTRAV